MVTRALLVAWVGVSLAIVGGGGAAHGAEPTTLEEVVARAQEAMAAKRYAEAAELMERAHQLAPHPRSLANAGYARMLAGQQDRAVESLSSALADKRLAGAERDKAVERLGRASSARAFVARASEAKAAGDLTAAARALDEAFVQVAIGPYALEAAALWERAGDLVRARGLYEEASAKGDLTAEQAQQAADGASRVTAALEAKAIEPAPEPVVEVVVPPVTTAPEVVDEGPGAAPWVVLGGGVAALGAGVVMFLVAEGDRSDVEDAIARLDAGESPGMTRGEAVAAEADADGLATFGVIAGGVGLAAIAAGLVWWAVADPAPETRGRVDVGVSWSPTGGLVTATGRF
ncbi:MAG: hypothetical protein IT385_06085 [Deltaproteobacteria bacterium]|nr:hypothetical protein [Deltaproteobacteria bacterium]